MGMKLAKNVITANAGASGTCNMSRPMQIQLASTKEIMACTRMNPESVFQIRVSTSVRCQPTL